MAECFPNMPLNWEPPAPAWKCRVDQRASELVVAHFGSQGADGATPLDAWLASAAGLPDGPDHLETAVFIDNVGLPSRLRLAYWLDPAAHERWADTPQVFDWWADPARLRDGPGYWREVYRLPLERFETIWSSPAPHAVGVRHLADPEGPMPEHGYWGAARDRLAASRGDPLESPLGADLQGLRDEETRGRRVIVAPPTNFCVIRSGQDWSGCPAGERGTYLDSVEPVLRAGMTFLAAHPLETGCVSCRYAQQVDGNERPLDRSFGLAGFLSLGHLERWASSHPTHLAIFDRFYELLKKHHFAIALRLYHELLVVPHGAAPFEYINCHNRTGLLTMSTVPQAGQEALGREP